MKKILLSFLLIFVFLFSGCIVSYKTVTFDSDGGTTIESQKIKTGEYATAPIDPVKENYEFKGWYLDDVLFDFPSTKIENNITLKAKWEENAVLTTYTVKFFDRDDNLLKMETVKEGHSATAPIPPKVEGFLFTGWDNDFSNVISDLEVRPIYEADTTEYHINYELNGGSWGYLDKDEYVTAFLTDFYSFVNPTEGLSTFMHGTGKINGFKGTWTNYVGGQFEGENKLLYNNDIDANNNDYFFNSKTYKDKWYNLSYWVKTKICANNNRFGGEGGYTYGILDFYRYIINDPAGYLDYYGDGFYKYPTLNLPGVSSYTYQDNDITLPKPLSKTFGGWYLNEDFSGEEVTIIKSHSQGDVTLYAKWNENVTYEIAFNTNCDEIKYQNVTVTYNEEVTLPTLTRVGYKFLGWYYNNALVNNTFVFTYKTSIVLEARWQATNYKLENLVYSGKTVTYMDSNVAVTIPNQYVQPDEQLRAAWVSSFAGNFNPSTDQTTMKNTLNNVLDFLESYNMNCIIFHIRTHNNAFYRTKLAPISSEYGTYESFGSWDYLTWFIEECHKRNIEFHAWLNPYRIATYGYDLNIKTSEIAAKYVNYPENPASNPDNILLTYYQGKSHGAILDPAKTAVQDYVVKVCLEVMKNYDVDAIHFDDYFYAQMSSNISVLSEPDQKEYEQYIDKYGGYSKTSASDKKNWRRHNVNELIRKLHEEISSFNSQYKRAVQLGISPTGIYRNGNGSKDSGSNTRGQEHYSSYLFCDSKYWVTQEWIDYILPQSYWAFTHSIAGYADVMDWWDKVVEGTNVNLYSGIGLYMATPNSNYSWGKESYEVSNQILYTTKLKNCKGVSFYNYTSLKTFTNDSSSVQYSGLMRVKEYWNTKINTPKTMASKYLEA